MNLLEHVTTMLQSHQTQHVPPKQTITTYKKYQFQNHRDCPSKPSANSKQTYGVECIYYFDETRAPARPNYASETSVTRSMANACYDARESKTELSLVILQLRLRV